jgi:hypothetical protein
MASTAAASGVVNRGMITATVMLATLMQALDTTIANVALPYMQGSLSATIPIKLNRPGALLPIAALPADIPPRRRPACERAADKGSGVEEHRPAYWC